MFLARIGRFRPCRCVAYEHMFPRLGQRLSTAVLDGLDVAVELTTLGEYGLAEDGRPLALEPERHGSPFDRSRDDCPLRDCPPRLLCAEARS